MKKQIKPQKANVTPNKKNANAAKPVVKKASSGNPKVTALEVKKATKKATTKETTKKAIPPKKTPATPAKAAPKAVSQTPPKSVKSVAKGSPSVVEKSKTKTATTSTPKIALAAAAKAPQKSTSKVSNSKPKHTPDIPPINPQSKAEYIAQTIKNTSKKNQKNAAFALPKIKTKSSVTYSPDYIHSVLTTPPIDTTQYNNQVRYSDAELAGFKDLIIKKMEAAKGELAYLQNIISKKGEVGFHDSDNKSFSIEEGGVGMEKEQLSQMARRQMQFIDHLEKALIRIENKTYGICKITGKLIDKERLKAVPHATMSLEAKVNSKKTN